MNYIAIIGDLVNSKEIVERAAVQQQLNAILEKVNQDPRFMPVIRSKFTITIGDEFQALLNTADGLFEILARIELAMHPIEIRFGIGIGKILTEIGPYSVGADGPAFWHARAAIEHIHEDNDFMYANIFVANRLSQDGYNEASEPSSADGSGQNLNRSILGVLNDLLSFRSGTQKRWTDPQRDVIAELLLDQQFYENFSRKEIAAKMGISSSALVKRVKAASILPYLRSMKHMEDLLTALI